MESHSLTVIWLATILLPCLLFLVGNSAPSSRTAALRALIAVLSGWALNFAYANVAQSVASGAVEATSGAALAFSATLGWVPAALVVLITWVAVAVKRRLRPNNSSKPTPLRGAA